MRWTRYPKYRDSGVEWLGEVPGHWRVEALKRGYEVCLGKMLQVDSASEDDMLLPYLRAANIRWQGVDTSDVRSMWFSPRERRVLKLRAGDVLVSEGGEVGRSCVWAGEIDECLFQNSVNRVRPRLGNSSRFLYYWMSTIKDQGYVDVLCNKSTIAHFTAEKLAAVPVPFPPSSEQLRIASFLDAETAAIDALVRDQEQLIKLLREKRQGIVSRALSRGANQSASCKTVRVDWLGEVPEYWSIGRLRNVCSSMFLGLTSKVDYVEEGGVPLVRATNIRGGVLDLGDVRYISETQHRSLTKRDRARVGDVLLSKSGSIGTVALVDTPIEFSIYESIFALRARTDALLPKYLLYLLGSDICALQFAASSVGMGVDHLNMSDLRDVVVALPPLHEQQVIVEYLDGELAQLNALAAEAQRGMELLAERRAALISAVVTGKIDVRHLVGAEAA